MGVRTACVFIVLISSPQTSIDHFSSNCHGALYPADLSLNTAGNDSIGGAVGFFGAPLAFLSGGVAEAFVPGAGAVETAKRVGKVLAAWLLGFCACGLVISVEY